MTILTKSLPSLLIYLPLCLSAALAALIPHAATAQSVAALASRYNVSVGIAELDTPALGSAQRGLNIQAGIDSHRRYLMGADYTSLQGDSTVGSAQLPVATQALLATSIAALQAAQLAPAGYRFQVVSHTRTELFSTGIEFNLPSVRGIGLFCHPGLGASYVRASFSGKDPVSSAILAQVVPSGSKRDWTPFYGGGGGFEVPLSSHFRLRSQLDVNWSHPFNDLLGSGSWNYRYTTGLHFAFGPRVAH